MYRDRAWASQHVTCPASCCQVGMAYLPEQYGFKNFQINQSPVALHLKYDSCMGRLQGLRHGCAQFLQLYTIHAALRSR